MSYIPLVLFLLAVAWIVWRGYSARRDYLKSRAESMSQTSREGASERMVESLTSPQSQGQVPELARMLGRDRETSTNTIGFQPPAVQR
jgi:hypothetical protein